MSDTLSSGHFAQSPKHVKKKEKKKRDKARSMTRATDDEYQTALSTDKIRGFRLPTSKECHYSENGHEPIG